MTRQGTPLTAREIDALRAVSQPGSSTARAAHELGVSHNAVHARLLRAYTKLGVSSATQAVYKLRREL